MSVGRPRQVYVSIVCDLVVVPGVFVHVVVRILAVGWAANRDVHLLCNSNTTTRFLLSSAPLHRQTAQPFLAAHRTSLQPFCYSSSKATDRIGARHYCRQQIVVCPIRPLKRASLASRARRQSLQVAWDSAEWSCTEARWLERWLRGGPGWPKVAQSIPSKDRRPSTPFPI